MRLLEQVAEVRRVGKSQNKVRSENCEHLARLIDQIKGEGLSGRVRKLGRV